MEVLKRENSQRVADFMIGAGQKVNVSPTKISAEDAQLRVRLLLEEVFELADASGVVIYKNGSSVEFDHLDFSGGLEEHQDLIEIADALTDIQYVNEGAALTWGIPLQKCFDLVADNNELKLKNGTINEFGKLVKPKDHPKVDLSFIAE